MLLYTKNAWTNLQKEHCNGFPLYLYCCLIFKTPYCDSKLIFSLKCIQAHIAFSPLHSTSSTHFGMDGCFYITKDAGCYSNTL